MRSWIAIIVMLILTSNCTPPKELSKEELQKYITDPAHGLVKEQEVKGIKIKLAFQPSDYLVAQELDGGKEKKDSILSVLRKKYRDQYYFVLNYSKDGHEVIRQLGSFGRYSEMVQVMAFQMGKYINATTGKRDTISLSDYQFEQTYGLSESNNLLLSFKKEEFGKPESVVINIGEFGLGTGAIRFEFRREDIERVPELKLN